MEGWVDSFFWYLMYLYSRFIRHCRCSFLDRYICKTLIFTIADALLGTNVSATYFSLNLQMLFSLSTILNCIYILPFLGFEDTAFANFASTSHIFDNVKMLPGKITHPPPTLSMPCGYSPVKMCILDLRFPWLADTPNQNFASSIP